MEKFDKRTVEKCAEICEKVWRNSTPIDDRFLSCARQIRALPTRGQAGVWVPRQMIENMLNDHIVSGSPGPLYGAGYAAACKFWAERMLLLASPQANERGKS